MCKLTQGPSVSHQQQRVADTTDTSGEDTDVEQRRRVLDVDGNPLREDKLERQREKFMLAHLVVRDRENNFREALFPDASGNVDPQLPMLPKVSCLVDALQLGGATRKNCGSDLC